jgi:hypothetical protein
VDSVILDCSLSSLSHFLSFSLSDMRLGSQSFDLERHRDRALSAVMHVALAASESERSNCSHGSKRSRDREGRTAVQV